MKNSLINKNWTRVLVFIIVLSMINSIAVFASEGYSDVYKSQSSVISLPDECVNGQVSVVLGGNTRTNLVPTFDSGEWAFNTNTTENIISPSEVEITYANTTTYNHNVFIDVSPNTTYTINDESGFGSEIAVYNEEVSSAMLVYGNGERTFNTGENTKIRVYMRNNGTIGTFTFKNIILEKGNTVGDYIAGTKSTLSVRLKSIGKNLFDKSKVILGQRISTGSLSNAIAENAFISEKIKVKTLDSITFSGAVNDVPGQSYPLTLRFLDVNGGYIKGDILSTPTIPNNAVYVEFSGNTDDLETIQLEKGLTATTYEPYKESISYYQLPQGKELRSLDNGTKDEISADGEYIQKVSDEYTVNENDVSNLIASQTNVDLVLLKKTPSLDGSFFYDTQTRNATSMNFYGYYPLENKVIDDVNSVWHYYKNLDNWVLIAPKGYYTDLASAQADLAGTTLNYQLAQPIKHDLNITPLTCFKNGTLIIDRAISESSIYRGKITIKNTSLPIQEIEEVNRIGNGMSSSVDLSSISVSSDGGSFTIEGAQEGDIYQYVYKYPEEKSTLPTIEYSVPISSTGQINSNTEAINQNSELINYILQQIELLRDEMQDLDSQINEN